MGVYCSLLVYFKLLKPQCANVPSKMEDELVKQIPKWIRPLTCEHLWDACLNINKSIHEYSNQQVLQLNTIHNYGYDNRSLK